MRRASHVLRGGGPSRRVGVGNGRGRRGVEGRAGDVGDQARSRRCIHYCVHIHHHHVVSLTPCGFAYGALRAPADTSHSQADTPHTHHVTHAPTDTLSFFSFFLFFFFFCPNKQRHTKPGGNFSDQIPQSFMQMVLVLVYMQMVH